MPYDIGKLKYWKGRKLSLEHRKKIKRSMGQRQSRELRSKVMKKAFAEGRLKAPWKGKHLPLSVRMKISETKKKQCQTPSHRKATSKFFKKLWQEHPEKLRAVLDKTINLWKRNPEMRARISKKLSEAGKRRFSDPAERQKMSTRINSMYDAHPNLKEEQRLRMKIYYELHPEARARLLENRKNPFADDISTLSGCKVRSEGEKEIVNFLFTQKIKFSYEAEPLYLPETQYVPDFWLPEYNCFIEFFGQHPKAQQTKFEKYERYRKYNIPCVFITPSELQDLKHYLMTELRMVSRGRICIKFKLEKWQNPFVGIEKISSLRKMASVFPRLKEDVEELEKFEKKIIKKKQEKIIK